MNNHFLTCGKFHAVLCATIAWGGVTLPTPSLSSEQSESCSTRGYLAWSLPITQDDVGMDPAEFFAQPELGLQDRLLDDGDRLEIANGPDNTPSLKSNVPVGENKRWGAELDVFDGPGIRHGCLTLRVYLSSGFDFNTAKTKLAWGLWGGQPKDSAGGVPPEMQLGWTIRNATNGDFGSKIYSYHLNRDGARYAQDRCDPYGCMYGKTTVGSGPLPSGRWFDVQLEVKVNDAGKANGFARMWIDGEFASEFNDIILSDDDDWLIQGLRLSDMWGGTTSDPSNFSPRYQSIWYADYQIYDMSKKPAAITSTASDTGRPLMLSPTGDMESGEVEFVWSEGNDVSAYHIKLVDDDLKVHFYESLSPNQADCGFEPGKCRFSGTELDEGSYKIRLRYVSNGIRSAYADETFTTSKKQPPAPKTVLAQIAPAGTIDDQQINFIFSPASGVDGYHVKLLNLSSNKAILYHSMSSDTADCDATQCQLEGPVLEPGQYQWNVRSVTDGKRTDYLKTVFEISKPAPIATALAPIGPSGSLSNKTLTLRWQPQTNSDRYFVKVVSTDGKHNTVFTQGIESASCQTSECKLNVPALNSGNYKWMVRAVENGVQGDYRSLNFKLP